MINVQPYFGYLATTFVILGLILLNSVVLMCLGVFEWPN